MSYPAEESPVFSPENGEEEDPFGVPDPAVPPEVRFRNSCESFGSPNMIGDKL